MLPYHESQYFMERSFLLHPDMSSPPIPQRPDPSPLFPLSSPTFDHDSLNELLLAQHLLPSNDTTFRTPPPPEPPTINNMDSTNSPSKGLAGFSRRRTLRKDRHSKICTAQGPRDRRMRLSLDVARRFFDLQDMLGLDKASRTVEWLLTKSDTAIKDLTIGSKSERHGCSSTSAKSESSSSDCEVISLSHEDKSEGIATGEANAPLKVRAKRVATRPLRKTSTDITLARESRLMARDRARERTKEKNISRGMRAAYSNPFEARNGEESSGTRDKNSLVELIAEVDQPIINSPSDLRQSNTIHERPDESLPLMVNEASGLISIFDYNQNFIHSNDNINFLHEQWNNMHSSGDIEAQQHAALSGNIQFQTRPWEVFYDPNL